MAAKRGTYFVLRSHLPHLPQKQIQEETEEAACNHVSLLVVDPPI